MSPLTSSQNAADQQLALPAPDLEAGLDTEDFTMGKWEAELSDWHHHCIPNGWMACVCPCVSLAQISARVEPGSFRAVLTNQLLLNLLWWTAVIVYAVFCFTNDPDDKWITRFAKYGSCVFVFLSVGSSISEKVTKLRKQVRERFQIPASEKGDSVFCGACAIAQMATQVKSYKPGSCGFNEPDALPAYIH